jgi:hypothetical protein
MSCSSTTRFCWWESWKEAFCHKICKLKRKAVWIKFFSATWEFRSE